MPEAPKSFEKERGLRVDPLYLTALASLGQSASAKLVTRPDKGSIAVLPFLNMSGDPGQEHFTDGLTEDIITDLSNAPGFFVIARNSTFAYKGKPTDVRQIAHDLGVKYVLEGSARRSDKRLRINVQLIDAAEGGNHIWAERFDRELADIFEVQDEVTRRIVEAVTGKLNASAIVDRYRPSNLEAYDLCVRSRRQWNQSKTANAEARSNLERAITLDPAYGEAYWSLAFSLTMGWLIWGEPKEPNRLHAMEMAQRAVEIDANDSGAHVALGFVLLNDRRWEEAEFHYETAIRLNPNNADALVSIVDLQYLTGRPQEALQTAAKALRLNPRPPGWYYWIIGIAQVVAGQYENAVATLSQEDTYGTASRDAYVAALALVGRTSEAQAEGKLLLSTNPHWRISEWVANAAFKNSSDANCWIEAFRLAGLPE